MPVATGARRLVAAIPVATPITITGSMVTVAAMAAMAEKMHGDEGHSDE